MLQVHRRVIAGIAMAQLEFACGRRAPISTSFAEFEQLIACLVNFRIFGFLRPFMSRNESEQFLAQARSMELLPDFESVKAAAARCRVDAIRVHFDSEPIEIDCRAGFITLGSQRLHKTQIVTSTQAVDMLAWLSGRAIIRPPEEAALLRDMLKCGLRPRYPHGWCLKRGLVPGHLLLSQEIDLMEEFRSANGIPLNV